MGPTQWLARRRVLLLVIPVLMLGVGCAKRPVSLSGSAPAPSGSAGTSMPPPRTLAEGPGVSRAAAPPSPGSAGAVSPSEFRPSTSLKDVHFDFDRYDIRADDARLLVDNAAWMKANPAALILIEGHADERGTNEYNLALGDRRAKATMTYLMGQGVAAVRITLISYGKERPTCTEHAEGCWAQNRRAHFLVKVR